MAFALRGSKLRRGKRFLPLRLSEEQRDDRRVRKLRDSWKLDGDMPESLPGPRV
jgi:hypothetical protein